MVFSVLAASVVDRVKLKTMKLVFAAIRSKSKDWLAQNQYNVCEYSNMVFTSGWLRINIMCVSIATWCLLVVGSESV